MNKTIGQIVFEAFAADDEEGKKYPNTFWDWDHADEDVRSRWERTGAAIAVAIGQQLIPEAGRIKMTSQIEPLHPNAPWFFKLESGEIIDLNLVYRSGPVTNNDGYVYMLRQRVTATEVQFVYITKGDYDRLCEIEAAMNEMPTLYSNISPEQLKEYQDKALRMSGIAS